MIQRMLWLAASAAMAWAQPSGVEETWQGTLDVGATKLRLGLHVSKSENGEWISTLDSIDQGAARIPVRTTTVSGGALHLEMPNLNAKYDGTLSANGSEINGTFTQGAALPLTFKRVEKLETLDRPQNPKLPFPYESVEVSYENKAGIKLAGTITLPRGNGPFPAAIMITGSGPQDRDETLLGHKPFLVIADYLTRRGIAILRVDDRGVGKSTGNSMRTTIDEMEADVLTGVEFLKGRKEIDPKRIGAIGHSEGGIVGPLAASRSEDIAFVVMLAGTGVTGEQVLYLQAEMANRLAGASDERIARNTALQRMMFDIMRMEPDEKASIEKIRAGWAKMKAGMTEAQQKELAGRDAALDAQIVSFNAPEIRSFLFYDPAETLRKLKVPVLAMNGSRDFQVPPKQNLPPIVAALATGGNSDFEVVELPGLNHLFQKCKKCSADEYGTLSETFSPSALEIMGDWLVRHTR